MTRHMPECYLSGPPNLCPMCEALRVCEQRVYDERNEAWVKKCRASERHALDAAREAVAAVAVRKDTSHDMRVQALAAIDALRGES